MRIICGETREIKRVICNCCGKEIFSEADGYRRSDYVSIEKIWGYFSGKDGERHHLDLCEACYDKWIRCFQIPVEIQQESELL